MTVVMIGNPNVGRVGFEPSTGSNFIVSIMPALLWNLVKPP
jgi:predicted Rdx family selenoprotein